MEKVWKQSNTDLSKKIVIVRTGGSILNIDTYNCQELGLAKALAKKGWAATLVLAGNKYEHRIIEVQGLYINVYYLTFKAVNQALSSFNGLIPLLEQLNPTHIQIHEFGMWMSFKVVHWAKKRNIPVYLIQGSYQTTRKPVFRQLEVMFNQTFGRYVLRNVSGIGCKSRMSSNYVSEYSTKKTILTPIGLDVQRFSHSEQIDWRKKLSIENKHVLLYVGILEQRRNPQFLLDIVQKMPDDYVLLVVGGGPMEEDVKRCIVDRALGNKCLMLGKLKQEQLPSLYKSADLFLLASDYEIYGMVLLEALYFGLPVITTLTAGSDILIEQGKNGFILDKDAKMWLEKITEIVENKQNLNRMKHYSSVQIEKYYTWEKAADNFINLYLNSQ